VEQKTERRGRSVYTAKPAFPRSWIDLSRDYAASFATLLELLFPQRGLQFATFTIDRRRFVAIRHERELLVVLHEDSWTLAFDSGDNTPVETRAFSGTGAVRVEIDPGSAHAIRKRHKPPCPVPSSRRNGIKQVGHRDPVFRDSAWR
jgi:hypothetical protein